MKVLFAPDYRQGNPYQARLAEALNTLGGCEVGFAQGYRRILPLTRLLRAEQPDLLHLHWPEAYFPAFGLLGPLRPWRLVVDLWLTQRSLPYVITAHNLWPHHHPRDQAGIKAALGYAYRHAREVIAHSTVAAELVAREWRLSDKRIRIIPHGNLAENIDSSSFEQVEAGARYALNFGTIAPYKGLEELIDWWKQNRPPLPLRIMGIVNNPDYQAALRSRVGGDELIQFQPGKISDEHLARQIVAASVVILNHTTGLTSSVASLSRSLGARILIPHRLAAIDLMEPHPSVFRFDDFGGNFQHQLEHALGSARPPAIDPAWWQATSWETVAAATLDCYRRSIDS